MDIKASDTDTSKLFQKAINDAFTRLLGRGRECMAMLEAIAKNLLSLRVPHLQDSSKPLPMVVDLACNDAVQLCKVLPILCGGASENLTETLDNFQVVEPTGPALLDALANTACDIGFHTDAG